MRIFRFLLIVVASSCATTLSAGTGAQLYNEFTDSDSFYPEQRWQQYVDELGQKLVQHSGDAGRRYYFFVLDSPEINAFATPDAYIYINRGLITYLSSEDQLAAVIGHEIAHVVARHAAKRKTTSLLGTGAGIAAMLLTGRGEMMQVADATTRTMIAGYGREMELEADRIGAEIIAKAGYNPLAVIESVHVLKDQELFSKEVRNQPSNYHGLFATHPQNDKRLHEAVEFAQAKLPETVSGSVRDFWSMLDGMKFGAEVAAGVSKPHIFYDKTLRLVIEFPIGWKVNFNNRQVLGTSPASRKDSAWISVVRHLPDDEMEPEEFVREVLKREDIETETRIDLDCCKDVYIAELTIESTDNTSALLAVFKRNQDVYVLRGEAGKGSDPKTFRSEFESVIAGIRALLPSDLDDSTTRKLKIVEARPGDTYESLARKSALIPYTEETLRLINGHHPTGEPRAGDFVKIIE